MQRFISRLDVGGQVGPQAGDQRHRARGGVSDGEPQPIKGAQGFMISDRAAQPLTAQPSAAGITSRRYELVAAALETAAFAALRYVGPGGCRWRSPPHRHTGRKPSARPPRFLSRLFAGAHDYPPRTPFARHFLLPAPVSPPLLPLHLAGLDPLRTLSATSPSTLAHFGVFPLASDPRPAYLRTARVDAPSRGWPLRPAYRFRLASHCSPHREQFFFSGKNSSFLYCTFRALGQLPQPPPCRAPPTAIEAARNLFRPPPHVCSPSPHLKFPAPVARCWCAGHGQPAAGDRRPRFLRRNHPTRHSAAGRASSPSPSKAEFRALFRGARSGPDGHRAQGTGAKRPFGRLRGRLPPGITYRSQRLRRRSTCRRVMPPLWTAHARIDGNPRPGGHFHLRPLRGEMEPTGHLSLSASGTVGRDAADDNQATAPSCPATVRCSGVNEYRQALQRSLGRHRLQEPDRRVLRQPARGTFVERPAVPACAALRRRLYRKLLRAQLEPRAVIGTCRATSARISTPSTVRQA